MYFIFILFVFLCVLVAALALLGNKRQKQHAPNVFTHDLAEAQPALTHLSKDRTHTQTHTHHHTHNSQPQLPPFGVGACHKDIFHVRNVTFFGIVSLTLVCERQSRVHRWTVS